VFGTASAFCGIETHGAKRCGSEKSGDDNILPFRPALAIQECWSDAKVARAVPEAPSSCFFLPILISAYQIRSFFLIAA
jgi:hypothetical protein